MKHTKHMNRGYTLIETLVALSILVAVVAGAATAAQTAISASLFSKNQTIAFYLAAEGIEMIRNTRDTNILSGASSWLTGIAELPTDPCYFGKACMVDSTTNTLIPCSGGFGTCPSLKQQSSTGLYGYSSSSGWVTSTFKRELMLTQVNADEVTITVIVYWRKGPVLRQFKVRENIFKWQ